MRLPETFDLNQDAVQKLERLRRLAIDYQVICMQAPHIWDGESSEDTRIAKRGCNGEVQSRNGTKKIAPCPIRNLCLQTALATRSDFGVWGGLAPQERKQIRRRKKSI